MTLWKMVTLARRSCAIHGSWVPFPVDSRTPMEPVQKQNREAREAKHPPKFRPASPESYIVTTETKVERNGYDVLTMDKYAREKES